MKKLLIVLSCLGVLAGSIFVFRSKAAAPSATNKSADPTKLNISKTPDKAFDKKQQSTDKPDSIWVVVNKPRPLSPINYAPDDLVIPNVPLRVPGNESMKLRKATAVALEQMFEAAIKDGLYLMLASGYRSYAYQSNLYNGYVASKGQAGADAVSARPGHSEHQTGLAADIEPSSRKCEIEQCFADTLEGKWLATNAYKYGFIIRYPADKVTITGYEFEPWHIRYIGTDLAAEMNKSAVETLEEFFGLKGGTSY